MTLASTICYTAKKIMTNITKTSIVPYSCEKMFNLVADIENYTKYLPWCTKSEIRHQEDNKVVAAVHLEYLKIKTHFVTQNIQTPFSNISMKLVDGPFKILTGSWNFNPLGTDGCKISFNLHYQFESTLLEKLIDPVFSYISKNIMDCFIQEARKQYEYVS